MGKDITSTFMALVSTKSPSFSVKQNYLPASTAFSKESQEIIGAINKLSDMIIACSDQNKDVRKLKSFVVNETKENDIDSLVNHFISSSFDKISKLKQNYMLSENLSLQQTQHREIVCESMLTFLKNVCQSLVQERTLRAQRVMEHMDISRLHRKHIGYSSDHSKTQNGVRHRHSHSKYSTKDHKNDCLDEEPKPKSFPNISGDFENYSEKTNEADFTKEEIQEFEEENDRMYQEFTSSLDEIQSIETKMVEISRLQDILTENLMTQEESVDNVAQNTINTTENIKQANVELLEALQHKAGFRVWILFILIVLTFSLLFLDWYNP